MDPLQKQSITRVSPAMGVEPARKAPSNNSRRGLCCRRRPALKTRSATSIKRMQWTQQHPWPTSAHRPRPESWSPDRVPFANSL